MDKRFELSRVVLKPDTLLYGNSIGASQGAKTDNVIKDDMNY